MHKVLLTNGDSFKVEGLNKEHIENLKECQIVKSVVQYTHHKKSQLAIIPSDDITRE